MNKTIDPAFDLEVQLWMSKYRLALRQSPAPLPTMVFFSLERPKLGVCYHKAQVVAIDPETCFHFPRIGRLAIVYHDLGHCVLGLGHSKDGIMRATLRSAHRLNLKWARWEEEYWNSVKKTP